MGEFSPAQPQIHIPPSLTSNSDLLSRRASALGNSSAGAAMTTIALSNGVMAADSYVSDDTTVMQVCKCARLPGGDVAGGAGDCGEVSQALAWLVKGGRGTPPEIGQASILYTVKGVGHLACLKFPGIRIKGDGAIGSGAQGALVAMRLGMSAEEAVKAVAGIDPHTGGEIDVLTVGPVRKPRKRK